MIVTAFPQSDARMVPASDGLYQAVVQQRLTLPDNDELRQHMANTIARPGAAGGWTSRRSNNQTTRSSRCAWRSRRWRTSPHPSSCSHGYDPLPCVRHPNRR